MSEYIWGGVLVGTYARVAVFTFLGLYLFLLIGIAALPGTLLNAFAGLTVGQWLVLILHVFSVLAAWIYVRTGPEPQQ